MKEQEAIHVPDLFSVAGKTALITGGSRGIGLMIARGLLEAGARVYISSRKKAACEEAAQALRQAGECLSLPADGPPARVAGNWRWSLPKAKTACTFWSTTRAPPGVRHWPTIPSPAGTK